MCLELYQRWQCCSCWGFIGPQTCSELFKKCLGPRGEIDKKIVKWNEGMCSECWDRFIQEARDMADAEAEAQRLAAMSTSQNQTARSHAQQGNPTWNYVPPRR